MLLYILLLNKLKTDASSQKNTTALIILDVIKVFETAQVFENSFFSCTNSSRNVSGIY